MSTRAATATILEEHSAVTDEGLAAFDALYQRSFRSVTATAFSLCGDWQVAEELAQEAFVDALRRWRRVGDLDRPDLWVQRVAINKAISSFRRKRAESRALRGLIDRNPPPPSDLTWLAPALRRLPPGQAKAVALVYVAQLSMAEAADVAGCTESTLRTHLQRGRERLREVIDPPEPPADPRIAVHPPTAKPPTAKPPTAKPPTAKPPTAKPPTGNEP